MSGEPTRLMETAASANQVGLPHRGERLQAKVPIGIAEARQLAGDRGTVNAAHRAHAGGADDRSEEHTSELQSLMRISYAVFCLKKKKKTNTHNNTNKQKNADRQNYKQSNK